ncbi:MAG: hypothetical protein BCS36_11300 [Desulfovibrio sp. MES5]|nr:MAG: hypothetical protein BCS36_11300 [Desulfovibrio sp. MES5]
MGGLLGGGKTGKFVRRKPRGELKTSLSFESKFLCPAGTGAFLLSSFGRLRGVRQGGTGYGAAPPSRPSLHPPEAPCLGFSVTVI